MKNFTLTLALFALAFASCSRDELTEPTPANSDQMSFALNTTRATINDLAALENSTVGFPVYATSGLAASSWYSTMDGTINYRRSANVWGWSGVAPLWPTTAAGYPMQISAIYPSPTTGLTITSNAPPALTALYIVPTEASQADLIAARSTVASKPFSGEIPMVFSHILSKVNFKVIPGNGVTVHLQSIGLNNLVNERSYNLIAGDWVLPQPTTVVPGYTYKSIPTPFAAATQITGTDANETTTHDVVPTNPNLMLMPQTTPSWLPSVEVSTTNKAHMSLIYRITTASSPNAIGYTNAANHPAFNPVTHAALNNKPLFVKVGYPFATPNLVWEKGKGYTYNVCLGTLSATNGYLLNDFYYDENGNVTTLEIMGKNIGDPVSNGTINFTVSVTNWTDLAGTTVQ